MAQHRSAKVLIFDKDFHVLVLRRSGTHPRDPFRPDLPGGIIEKSESFPVGVSREIVEETALRVDASRLVIGAKIGSRFTFLHRVLFVTMIDQVKPQVTISWEHDQYDWVALDSITELETSFQNLVDTVKKKDVKRLLSRASSR